MTNNSQQIDNFVATLDEVLRFLDSYKDDLFYIDINPSTPPAGARQFAITTFKPAVAAQVIDEIHPGPKEPRITPEARQKLPRLECGMNIQPTDSQGYPNVPPDLAKSKWVRFPFITSPRIFPTIEQAFTFYDGVINAYNNLGVKMLVVFTIQTYGETSGMNFNAMDSAQWHTFTASFVAVVEKIVRRYGNKIAAYEVWNEGDVDPGNPAAVALPAADFAPMLAQSAQVIRTYAPQSKVIFGGLVTAASKGSAYAVAVKNALGGRLPVDAIGVHPYGLGAPNDGTPFGRLGSVQALIDTYNTALPNVPLWFTEVGALGANEPPYWGDAATYMRNLFTHLRSVTQRVPVVIWYAWSDAMHVEAKTNGVVNVSGQPKEFLYQTFFSEAVK